MTTEVPRVCKRWFPNGGSSSVGERNSATPFLPQFNPLFTSMLPEFYLNLTSAQPAISNHGSWFPCPWKLRPCQRGSFRASGLKLGNERKNLGFATRKGKIAEIWKFPLELFSHLLPFFLFSRGGRNLYFPYSLLFRAGGPKTPL